VIFGYNPAAKKRIFGRTLPSRRPVGISLQVPGGRLRAVPLDLRVVPPPLPRLPGADKPYAGTLVNLVANPSVESDKRGWITYDQFVKGLQVRRREGQAPFGSSFLEVANSQEAQPARQGSGVYFTPIPTRAGLVYTASVFLRGATGAEIVEFVSIDTLNRGSVVTHSKPVALTRTWKRHAFTFPSSRTSKAMVVLLEPVATSDDPVLRTFYVDGLQVEAGARASPYCDGTIHRCRWRGAPHASPSARAGSTTLAAAVPSARRPGTRGVIEVDSTARPMPRRTPFTLTIGGEAMQVTAIAGPTRYAVRRGSRGTRPAPHPAGARVLANFPRPRRIPARDLPPPVPQTGAVIALEDLRIAGLPPPRNNAERVWNRWFARTPAALEGDGPGLVDNLYVSWLYQYGVLGAALCLLWIGALLLPALRRHKGPATTTATLVGAFLLVSAVAVSVWEEFPTDFLAAIVFAHAFSEMREKNREPAEVTPSAYRRRGRRRAARP